MADTDNKEGAAILSAALIFSVILFGYALVIGDKNVQRLKQYEASCPCPLPSIQPTTTKTPR